jgi:hypothetical protein
MNLVDIAREFLEIVNNDLNKYTSENGWVTTDQTGATLFTPAHIQFAKYGRGPGKMPPIDPLVSWIKKKGIVTDDKEAKGMAFAIAKTISRKGTINYVPNAPNAIEEALTQHIGVFNEKLLKLFSVEVAKETKQVAERIIVPLEDFKICLLYTSPSPRDRQKSRMPSSA